MGQLTTLATDEIRKMCPLPPSEMDREEEPYDKLKNSFGIKALVA